MRQRRRELGLSQTRVAHALGVSPLLVGRWERGEADPDPLQMRALADALEMAPAAADEWAAAAAPVLPVEIVPVPRPVLAPALDPDPWAVPPEKRIAPPRLDREALMGRRDPAEANGGPATETAVVPLTAGPDPTVERLLRRQARSDERRLRRRLHAERRAERAWETAEIRRREVADAAAARLAAVPAAPRRRAPAPAGAANTGVVFPVPDTKRGSERVTYEGVGDGEAVRERGRYVLRVAATAAVLAALAVLLWWAVGSLGDGLGAVVDLLRGRSGETGEVAGLMWLG
ncbi:MAG: helix-turn-helix domain-containing protein [Actinobacteria bacterium]|nr:helix-turn-helix domain-containing protein [Actinomycetota bacterium]